VRVVDAVDPVVGPRGFDFFRLGDGVVPEGQGIVMPDGGDGGHAAAGGRLELVEVGLGGVLGVGEGVHVDEDGADDVLPLLAVGEVVARAAAVVAGGPVVEQGRAHVVDEVELLRAAADVLVRRIDEVDADVVLGGGPAPGGELVHVLVVAVFVLDGILIDAARCRCSAPWRGRRCRGCRGLPSALLMSILRSWSTESQSKVGFICRMKRLSPSPAGG
jgi:hypothetical protein